MPQLLRAAAVVLPLNVRRRSSHDSLTVERPRLRSGHQEGDRDLGAAELVTVDKPKEIYERGMLAPSFIAYLHTSEAVCSMFRGFKGYI